MSSIEHKTDRFLSGFGIVKLLFLCLFTIGSLLLTPKAAHAATVTLAPSSGVAGSVVLITGASFDNSSTATITWDGAALTTTPATVTTSGSGAIPSSGNVYFTVPSGTYGTHTVQITTGTTSIGVATYTISTPTVAVTSPSGTIPTGATLTVTATNMEANATTTFYFDNVSQGTATSTANGTAELTFTVPAVDTTATHIIRASNSTYAVASVAITLATPALTLSPITGALGLRVTASGTGFKYNSTVNFYANGALMDATVTTNHVGQFSTTLEMPTTNPSGAQTIRAQTDAANFGTATYTVLASAITASPSTGTPGTKVSLTGTNFNPNNPVTVKWNGTTLAPAETNLKANSAGSFTANITIPPDYVSGNGQIEVSTSLVATVLTTFTIAAPTLTAATVTGIAGAKVSITGTNFEGNQVVKLTWDDTPLTTTPAKIITTPLGSFTAVFTVPSSNQGLHVISATAGNQKINFTEDFTVTAAALTLSTTTSQSNTKISAFGTGFSPHKTVNFSWDASIPLESNPPIATADANGYFSASIVIPPRAAPGTHVVQARTTEEVFDDQTFTVTTGSIDLSRANGPPLGKVQITGEDFDANSTVSFFWDDQLLDTTKVTTDSIGGFLVTITLPVAVSGVHTLRASTSELSTTLADFTIDTPTLTIQPPSSKIGGEITIQGIGFAVGRKIKIMVGNTALDTNPADLYTDGNGNFTATVKLPFILGQTTNISARTGNEDVAIIPNYPVIHSALYNLISTIGKYGLLTGFLLISASILLKILKAKPSKQSLFNSSIIKELSWAKQKLTSSKKD